MIETVSLTLIALVALWLLRGTAAFERSAVDAREWLPPSCGQAPAVRLSWGSRLGTALLLLLPHLTLLLVPFVPEAPGQRPRSPAYTGGTPDTDPGSGAGQAAAQRLWLASAATVAAVRIALAAGVLSVRRRAKFDGRSKPCCAAVGGPGTVFAIALATAFSVQRAPAGDYPVGTLWLLPLATS